MGRIEGPRVPPSWNELAVQVKEVGRSAGLTAVGITDAEPLLRARAALHERKAEGLHDTMAFTYGNPDRATDPRRTMPDCQAIVVAALRYRREDTEPAENFTGRVARYAHSDYYARLRVGLKEISAVLKRAGWKAFPVLDDNRLVDREVAWRAGIGWFGKNANLLLPNAGSWFVLGSVLTTAPLPPNRTPLEDGCGTCSRCLPACPTGAIIAPGVVDARRCLAWLVQAPGSFPHEYRVALGDRVYGCDDCQEVCPPNRAHDRRVPPPQHEVGARPWVDLIAALEADDPTLLAHYGRWYLPNRDPSVIRRNALIALGNVVAGEPERTKSDVSTAADSDDRALHRERARRVIERYVHGSDGLLAEHASWALGRIGGQVTR